jgi:hypothetical protein
MKAYKKPEVKVYEFSKEDVITTSGVVGTLDDADYTKGVEWQSDWDQLNNIGG